jgi:hypothetical protein
MGVIRNYFYHPLILTLLQRYAAPTYSSSIINCDNQHFHGYKN